jgi:hypothetical protein
MQLGLKCGALWGMSRVGLVLNMKIKALALRSLLAGTLFISISCVSGSTDRATCEQQDWYELGRRDGAEGIPAARLADRQKQCSKSFNPRWEAMYANGRNAGLVDYCDGRNAYELGKSEVPYFSVCPSTVEQKFLAAYHRGQDSRNIELQNQMLDNEINDLTQRIIDSKSDVEVHDLQGQLTELRSRRVQNERELRTSATRNE